MTLSDVLLSMTGALLLIIWGLNIWEIRKLRDGQEKMVTAISALTVTLARMDVALSHKVDDTVCAAHHAMHRMVRLPTGDTDGGD